MNYHKFPSISTKYLNLLFILLIILLGSLTLLFRIGEVPPLNPWSDESEIAADAVDTLRNGPKLFYPGQLAGGSLAVWLEVGWMALFGKSLLGLRILNGLVNLISALLLYLLIQQLPFSANRRWLAVSAASLFAVSTWLLGLGRIAAPNWSLVPLLTNLTFYCFWLGLNTKRRRYFIMTGGLMGLFFYGYLPGYFVPLVPVFFLVLVWVMQRKRFLLSPASLCSIPPLLLTICLILVVMLLVAAPMLIFFTLNPAATLQRPLQLAGTNELSTVALMAQGTLDMLSTFGLFPNWLGQGRFEHLAFDPLVTILFVVGLMVSLWRWREPVYLFLLIWWAVMITPALLSRSASLGFIFEVWRRGVGAQSVSFIFAAIGLLTAARLGVWEKKGEAPKDRHSNRLSALLAILVVITSAGLSYWLYFGRWANSGIITTLFAETPVRLVEWMQVEGQANTLYLFPLRPNVSPTTRPELFSVRYLYEGQAQTAFPTLDETTIDQVLSELLENGPAIVKLMMPDRIEVDPKGYLSYALASRGTVIAQEKLYGYTVTTYQRRSDQDVTSSFEAEDVIFGDVLRLTAQQIRPAQPAAGQTLGIALTWRLQQATDVAYNLSLALEDGQDYEWVRIDKPLLNAENYLTTPQWSPGDTSTVYYALPIPPDAPPGSYELIAVIYNAETGERLPTDGSRIDLSLPLATVQVGPNLVIIEPSQLPIDQRLNHDFPSGLRLLGLAPAEPYLRPGERLSLTLWWQTTGSLPRSLGLMLALAAPGREPIFLLNAPQPLIADFPTIEWLTHQTYRANYDLRLPATVTTGDYGLVLGLLDLDTGEALAQQQLLPLPVEGRTHLFEASALAHPLNIDFDETIRLRGFELAGAPSQLLPGENIQVKIQWQALAEMDESYKIFLHLTNSTGQILSQVDTIPQQGAAPTTGWLPGEIIEDELRLTIPADLSTDSYRLILGLYNEDSGQRLSVGSRDQVVLVEDGKK